MAKGLAASTVLSLALLLTATATAQSVVNVAPVGTATQSSTGFGGEASRGNDGNTDGVYGNNSVTHTATGDPTPWWEVEFEDEFDIDTIVLWNRTDSCCPQRLTNFVVFVLDADRAETFSEEYFSDGIGYPDTTVDGFEIEVGSAGAVVRIELLDDHPGFDPGQFFLSLAEVQVFAAADDLAPVITRQPQGGRAFVGGTFTFSVEAIGSEPFSYQWEKDEVAIDGATEQTLVLVDLKFEDAGEYSVVVSNNIDSVTSDVVTLEVTPPNLARCGTATQSTTGFGGTPERGIDGNTDGVYNNGSVTHTNGDPMGWWEVTLSASASIETIALWNRTDCCQERLSNFTVFILNAAREEVWSDEFFTDGTFPETIDSPYEIDVGGIEGRIIRIEKGEDLSGGGLWLSLAEVEVFGDGPCVLVEDQDLTGREGVVASHNSQLGDFHAGLGIDDNLGNFTHTQAGTNLPATWEVDLGGSFDIGEVVLYNRTSCCGSRLRDITVSILDSSGAGETVLWESELLNPENELGTFPNGPPELRLDLIELSGGPVSGGRVVRVVRTPDEDLSGSGGQGNADEGTVLSLGEVEVFEPAACPAPGDEDDADTHCTGITVVGPDDGGPGDYRITADGADASGDLVEYTFTAFNRLRGTTETRGPQPVDSVVIPLSLGEWDISVAVDDDPRCDDQAADAICTETIEVIDPSCVEGELCNVAPRGVATQSSTGFGGTPERGNDGITDGVYNNGSVTHTNGGDPSPTWEVELDQDYLIETIVLWNRVDCCSGRLTNFTVAILDADREEIYLDEFFTDGIGFPDTNFEGYTIDIGGEEGRIVRVELEDTHPGFDPDQFFLSLAEVQIFAEPASAPGASLKPGDADGDGRLNIADPVALLGFLFGSGGLPACFRAPGGEAALTAVGRAILDFNGDGTVNISDAVAALGFLFGGGAAPHVLGEDCVRLAGSCDSACQ